MSDLADESFPGGPADSDPGPGVPEEFLVTPSQIAPPMDADPGESDAAEPPPAAAPGLSGREIVVAGVLTVLIVFAGLGLLAVALKLRPAPKRQAALATFTAVRVQAVVNADVQESLTGYGRVRAVRSSNVAAQVGGTVGWISPACEAGAWVEQGEVLVRVDPRELQSAFDAAAARAAQSAAALARAKVDAASVTERLALAREELDVAQQEYDRLKSLPGTVTRSQLDGQYLQVSLRRGNLLQLQRESDGSGPAVAAASADLAAAQAAQDRAQLDLERAEMRAPFAGEIGERMVHEGQRIAPGAPLFHLTDAARLEVPVALAARHFGEVQVGAALTLRRGSGGEVVWAGTVARIAPRIDDMDRTFFVYAEIVTPAPPAGGRLVPVLAPGAFVIGEVQGPLHARTIAVPRSAFLNDRAFVAIPTSVVAYVASDRSARTPEERAAQAAQLGGIAAKLAALLPGVPGCGAVDPPVGSDVVKVVAAFRGTESWEAVTARVRAAVRGGGLLAQGVTVTVGTEAIIEERVPSVTRRLPEVALVRAGLQEGELLVVTNLEQVAAGGRVRLVGEQSEQVRLPPADDEGKQ